MKNKKPTDCYLRTTSTFASLLHCEKGGTAIEYALIGSIVSIIIVGALTLIGISLNGKFTSMKNGLS